MWFKALFNKASTCEKCSVSLPKKQLSTYDASHQGRNKYGSTKKVCNNCLMDLFYESLRNFNETAVVVAPDEEHNSYVYYNFDKLLNTKQSSHSFDEDNKTFINDLMELLPQSNSKCNCCGIKATYTWCSSELLYNDPFLWEVNKSSGFEPVYLCKECLIKEFKKRLEDENIIFEFICPPLHGSGFLCSWDT